eukprot:CAMPEP_0171459256 /NCGR_PEP_ID=MMETSP0945-20130129/4610_1 /TAXON_ID=109269 /ORGANISM="Vaucheria litorea, Strain CCMP2940" /LENGTH=205 /DNA_ID=CAMNT_0011985233 /DNA_START=57 /DNA_END=674 /DNA_ORIENTATION=-
MKFLATSALCLASALAFAPPSTFSGHKLVKNAKKSASMKMEFAGGLIGADGPEPLSKNFDPLALAERNPTQVKFYREAEIKHGRIAMLAVLGMVVPDFVRLPGDIFQNVSTVEAHNAMVEKGPMFMLLFWISLFELISTPLVWKMDTKDREPGYFALDPLGFCKDPEKKKKYQLNELKNGRLAMLAFSGMITQTVLTGHGFPFLY